MLLFLFGLWEVIFHLAFATRSFSLSAACYNEGHLQNGLFLISIALTGDTKD